MSVKELKEFLETIEEDTEVFVNNERLGIEDIEYSSLTGYLTILYSE